MRGADDLQCGFTQVATGVWTKPARAQIVEIVESDRVARIEHIPVDAPLGPSCPVTDPAARPTYTRAAQNAVRIRRNPWRPAPESSVDRSRGFPNGERTPSNGGSENPVP